MGDVDGEVSWYEADPRGILPLHKFHIPHDLKRLLRQRRFQVTLDQAFNEVVYHCAHRGELTWITEEIIHAYTSLHELGYAHSVESWYEGELVGGLYGVAIGGAFFGESMFHKKTDASKVALAHLAQWLRAANFALCDVQMVTDVLRRFGAIHVSKAEYHKLLRRAVALPCELRAVDVAWS